MIHKCQLAVVSMTMIGVWVNMFINLKRESEIIYLRDHIKDARGSRGVQSGEGLKCALKR